MPIAVLAAIAGCTMNIDDNRRETTLRCRDCAEVRVNQVIDGDTLDTARGRIRLYGIDTPERGEHCAPEATVRLRELAGDSVRLEDGPRQTDQFGRILAYTYSSQGGASIDETLIREGLATAWTRDGQYRDLLTNLEREARREGAGCLW